MSATHLNPRAKAASPSTPAPPADTKISLSLNQGHLVVETPKRLDFLVTLPGLKDCRSFQGSVRTLEIRMHKTTYIDSSGLSYLLLLSDLLPSRTVRPQMTGIDHPAVKAALGMANFHRLFDMQPG